MRIVTPERLEGEEGIEKTLRPSSLNEFTGQTRVKENLGISITAARKRDEAMDHCLFYGPPGLGKTTLAYIMAKELDVNIIAISGPVIEKPGDLCGILTKLEKRDVLFIDEIHRIGKPAEEYLYPAMEDFKLDIMLDTGPNARSIRINLNPFTLIGATTRTGTLSSPLRSRFDLSFRLGFYSVDELELIIRRSSEILKTEIDTKSCFEIAKRARGTPRIGNRLLKRVRDYAEVKSDGKIKPGLTKKALDMLGVDETGFGELDKEIISTIVEKYNGGPVGLNTIATSISEESETIEDVFEPYLIQQGFIKRTSRGREATQKAYQYLKRKKTPLF